jgi:minor histocompatibility antigen H13
MFTMRTPSLFLVPLGTLPALLYTFWPPGQESILISDILSVSFAHATLSNLKLDTFQTGCVLLFGLFMYDVWFVLNQILELRHVHCCHD